MKKEEKNVLKYFHKELPFPKLLTCDYDEIDFILLNTHLDGVVSRALKGECINTLALKDKKFDIKEYLTDAIITEFRNIINNAANKTEKQEVTHYFETYKQVAKILSVSEFSK